MNLLTFTSKSKTYFIAQDEAEYLTAVEVLDTPDQHAFETELEAVESAHEYHNYPSDEQDLSDRYDQFLEELGQTENFEREYFNNWKDSEQTEGRLHKAQDDNYEYVGRYDND